MSGLKAGTPTFPALPLAARAYVGAVVVAGAGCLMAALWHVRLEQPFLFAGLLALAVAISVMKIDLPLGRSHSNLSLSHAVTFWSLFALGPAETVCIAAVSAWAQCTLRVEGHNPLHRVLFSIASLIVTVTTAAMPLALMPVADATRIADLIRDAAVVAPLYFFVNSGLVDVRGPPDRRARAVSHGSRRVHR